MSPRPRLSDEQLHGFQRKRIQRAFAELISERGYAGTKIGDVTGRAGVARKTFYLCYDGKQAAFEAMIGNAVEYGRYLAEEVEGGPTERARAALGLVLGDPALAKAVLVEGPQAWDAYLAATARAASLVGGDDRARFVAGGVESVLRTRLALGEPPDEQLVEGLATFVGTMLEARG